MSQIIENYVPTVLANLLELLIKHRSVGKSASLGISFLWSLCHINCLSQAIFDHCATIHTFISQPQNNTVSTCMSESTNRQRCDNTKTTGNTNYPSKTSTSNDKAKINFDMSNLKSAEKVKILQ